MTIKKALRRPLQRPFVQPAGGARAANMTRCAFEGTLSSPARQQPQSNSSDYHHPQQQDKHDNQHTRK
jgi:hypothetical protein